jgi:hypothetical protein
MSQTPTKAAQAALKWLKDHGGSAAVAKTKAGGRIYLAAGEQGEFMPSTVKQLVGLGLLEKRDGRIWVKP